MTSKRGEVVRTIRHGDPKIRYPYRRGVNEEPMKLDSTTQENLALDAHAREDRETRELLREALGQLGVAHERIVTLEKALRAVEWHDSSGCSWHCCPVCYGVENAGHADDCQLAAALCDHRGDCTHIEAKEPTDD